jgi:hypothetical protein
MEDTYRRIESQIEQRSDSLQRLAKHSLTWVLYAKRRLNEDELCEAVSFEPSTEPRTILQRYTLKDILDACANLLYLEDVFCSEFSPNASEDTQRCLSLWGSARIPCGDVLVLST